MGIEAIEATRYQQNRNSVLTAHLALLVNAEKTREAKHEPISFRV